MTLLTLFAVFFLVNLLTVGGGYVALPLLQQYLVEDLGWLTHRELAEAVVVGQLSPGPLTIMNTFIGHRVGGLAGAVTATVATYLPSVAVGSLAARWRGRLARSATAAAALRGMSAAVVGLLLAVTLRLAADAFFDPVAIGIGVASFALLAATRCDPTLLMVLAAVAGAAFL